MEINPLLRINSFMLWQKIEIRSILRGEEASLDIDCYWDKDCLKVFHKLSEKKLKSIVDALYTKDSSLWNIQTLHAMCVYRMGGSGCKGCFYYRGTKCSLSGIMTIQDSYKEILGISRIKRAIKELLIDDYSEFLYSRLTRLMRYEEMTISEIRTRIIKFMEWLNREIGYNSFWTKSDETMLYTTCPKEQIIKIIEDLLNLKISKDTPLIKTHALGSISDNRYTSFDCLVSYIDLNKFEEARENILKVGNNLKKKPVYRKITVVGGGTL